MKTVRNILSVFVAILFALSTQAQTRGVAAPVNNLANPTAAAAPVETIQSSGAKSSGSSGTGKMLGQVAMGVTAAGVAMTCFSSNPATKAKCPYFAAGLAASIFVTMAMGKAKGESDATVAAVTTGASASTNSASATDYTSSPDWKAAQDAMGKLKAQGYKFDDNGGVTDPNGKKFSSETFASEASMSKAGYSGTQIQALNAEKVKLQKAIEAKVKAADGSDMFGGEIGGGGGKPAISVDGSLGNDSPTGAVASTQGLGINRDPAQVAGMTKNLGGDPIGVSGDSLFKMIDRRYELHNTQGSFLTGP